MTNITLARLTSFLGHGVLRRVGSFELSGDVEPGRVIIGHFGLRVMPVLLGWVGLLPASICVADAVDLPRELALAGSLSSDCLIVVARSSNLKQMLDLYHTDLDGVFRALANSGRRSMIDRLTSGPATLGELAEPLDMTLSAVEQHSRVLERCGLIRTEKRGRVRSCRLEPAQLKAAEKWMSERRELWERRLDRLGDILEDER